MIPALLLFASALCGLFLLVVAIECGAALLGPRPPHSTTGRRPLIAILVPAHNEEAVLDATLASLLPQLAAGDRILVIADNCSDGTAALARAMGADVLERTDLQRRGKSYALDFAVQHLAAQPAAPEVILIVDADTPAAPGAVDELARAAARWNRPIQGTYLLQAPPDQPRQLLAQFAFAVRNLYRPAGLHRLGLPCLLNGSGMAFPWSILRNVNLASGRIAEDRWLAIDLAVLGHPVQFSPARVTGDFPPSAAAAGTQRERWEHGHLETLIAQGPRLLAAALRRRDPRLLALALELSVPPLSLLAAACLLVLAADLALGAFAALWAPFLACAAPAALAAAVLFLVWRDAGALPLNGVPGFVLSKLPLYLLFVTNRRRTWVPTARPPRAEGRPPE